MVGNPAWVGVCGIEKRKRKKKQRKRRGKDSLAQASEASNRQLEIENTLAPVPAGRSERQGQPALQCCLRGWGAVTGVATLGLLVRFWASLHIPNFKIPTAGTQSSNLLFIGLIVKDVGGSKCLLSPPKMTFSDYRAEAEWLLSIQQHGLFNKPFLSRTNTHLRTSTHLTITTEISCLFTPACFHHAGRNKKFKLCFWLSSTAAESRPTPPFRITLQRVKSRCALFNGCVIVMTTAA